MADSGHPPAELHERLLICRTIKLNAGAHGGHRRCCHAQMQKNAQNKPQIAWLILCVHTTLQVYCNLFLTFCRPFAARQGTAGTNIPFPVSRRPPAEEQAIPGEGRKRRHRRPWPQSISARERRHPPCSASRRRSTMVRRAAERYTPRGTSTPNRAKAGATSRIGTTVNR